MEVHSKFKSIKLIAIAGPTASGKTTLAKKLSFVLGRQKAVIISQDNYYRDWSHLPLNKRKKINFDDLKSFDLLLLYKQLLSLEKGNPIQMSLYDFVKSKRLKRVRKVNSALFVIVEGLMPFFNARLRKLFCYKVYVNTPNWLCLARRITRDTKERGESIASVCKRYFEDVRGMQKRYVEPQKQWADMVIDGSSSFDKKLISNIAVQCKKCLLLKKL